MSDMETLEELSKEYRSTIPSDLRRTHSFGWYLEELYEDPKVARNAHQRLADMFDHYGTSYDEEAGIVEYEIASADPLGDGQNTFYGRVIHEAIHEFTNKVKSGARGLGPEKRIKLLLGPVGSGKSDFDRQIRRYFEDYTTTDAGRMLVKIGTRGRKHGLGVVGISQRPANARNADSTQSHRLCWHRRTGDTDTQG